MTPLPGFAPEQWQLLHGCAEAFLDHWASQAAKCGWNTLEVWGCHTRAPLNRYDSMGLVLGLAVPWRAYDQRAAEIVRLTDKAATVRVPTGGELLQPKRLTAPVSEITLLWNSANVG